jgi:hypothetical protein
MFDIDKLIIEEYSGQRGYGTLPFFVGKQYGTGWLRNIARFAFPFIKKAFGAIGNIASNVGEDMVYNEGKPIVESLKEHAVKEVGKVLKRNGDSSINRGAGKKFKYIKL